MLNFLTLSDADLIAVTAPLELEMQIDTKICIDCGIVFTPLKTLDKQRVTRCPECAREARGKHDNAYRHVEHGGEIMHARLWLRKNGMRL